MLWSAELDILLISYKTQFTKNNFKLKKINLRNMKMNVVVIATDIVPLRKSFSRLAGKLKL